MTTALARIEEILERIAAALERIEAQSERQVELLASSIARVVVVFGRDCPAGGTSRARLPRRDRNSLVSGERRPA